MTLTYVQPVVVVCHSPTTYVAACRFVHRARRRWYTAKTLQDGRHLELVRSSSWRRRCKRCVAKRVATKGVSCCPPRGEGGGLLPTLFLLFSESSATRKHTCDQVGATSWWCRPWWRNRLMLSSWLQRQRCFRSKAGEGNGRKIAARLVPPPRFLPHYNSTAVGSCTPIACLAPLLLFGLSIVYLHSGVVLMDAHSASYLPPHCC